MEKDFDGFVNYVYGLKKDRDMGKEIEVSDIQLF